MTKIAISVLDATGLDAPISPHFGRCPYFTVVEIDADKVQNVESVSNPYYCKSRPSTPCFFRMKTNPSCLTAFSYRSHILHCLSGLLHPNLSRHLLNISF